jgi:hypothetical protein
MKKTFEFVVYNQQYTLLDHMTQLVFFFASTANWLGHSGIDFVIFSSLFVHQAHSLKNHQHTISKGSYDFRWKILKI